MGEASEPGKPGPSGGESDNSGKPDDKPSVGPMTMLGLLTDIKLSVYVFVFVSLLSCFSKVSWIADLFCQFRVQMAVGLAFMTFLLLVSYRLHRAHLLVVLTVFSLVLNVVCVFWTNISNPAAAPEMDSRVQTAHVLKLLQFNLNTKNDQYDKFVNYALKLKPDIICLEEYGSDWATHIGALKKEYLFEISEIRNDNFGVAILSRYPLQNQAIIGLGKAHVPSAFAQVELNGKLWSILATHPLPPITGSYYDLRNEQYKSMAEFIKSDRTGRLVLAGDLNCAPWSAHLIDFLQAASLKDSRRGTGIQPTWPVNCSILRIPLDYVLTSKSIQIKLHRVEPDLGSDHLPVYVELSAD